MSLLKFGKALVPKRKPLVIKQSNNKWRNRGIAAGGVLALGTGGAVFGAHKWDDDDKKKSSTDSEQNDNPLSNIGQGNFNPPNPEKGDKGGFNFLIWLLIIGIILIIIAAIIFMVLRSRSTSA